MERLAELREFLAFFTGLWGMLAGFTVFFPLFNQFLKVVPIAYTILISCNSTNLHTASGVGDPNEGYPFVHTTIITVILIFYVFFIFTDRNKLRSYSSEKLRNKARLSFFLWFVLYFIYLFIYMSNINIPTIIYFYVAHGDTWICDLYRYASAIGNLIVLFLYFSIFFLITRAFLYLGLIEFLRKDSTPEIK